MKNTTLWGVSLTSMEEMMFMKWIANSNAPRPNTLNHEERVYMLNKWLSEYRSKTIG